MDGVLARDDVFLNTASDLDVLERTLDAAQRFFAGGASDDAALRDALAAEQASALFVRGYAA